jgi:hypothetical protein
MEATPPSYTTANKIMDDTFSGTTLNTKYWSTVTGGPIPVGHWSAFGTYGAAPVVDNGLTLTNTTSPASAVDTSNPATGQKLFSFPAAGWYLQTTFKTTDTSNGFFPAIWFPFSNHNPNGNEIDLFEGGTTGYTNDTTNPSTWTCVSGNCTASGGGTLIPYNSDLEGNFGGGSGEDPYFDQHFYDTGLLNPWVDVTKNFVTLGVEFIPGQHVNFYYGQGANRVLLYSDTNTADIGAFANYNLQITPQNGGNVGGWHSSGAGTGSMFISEVQVYSLP